MRERPAREKRAHGVSAPHVHPKSVLARARESGTAELTSVWFATIAARRPMSSSIAPTTTAAIHHAPKPMAIHAAIIEQMPASTTGLTPARSVQRPAGARDQYARRAGNTHEARHGRAHAMEHREHRRGHRPESAVADAEHELYRRRAPYAAVRAPERDRATTADRAYEACVVGRVLGSRAHKTGDDHAAAWPPTSM